MDFDFDEMAYPDTFLISGIEFKGRRNADKNQVDIPFTEDPVIELGDVFIQKIGSRELNLKTIDISISKNGTLNVGTIHPHLLTLSVENISSNVHKTPQHSNTFNIGSVSGEQVQIGERNHLQMNINVTELVERVIQSGDPEAKSLLKSLLNNATIASIIGAGTSALLGLL